MRKLKKIVISKFAASVLWVSAGTGIAQLLNILLSPVITRVYKPEDYGILTIYTAVLGILTIVGSLKYELAIAIADDDEKAINILTLSVIILIIYIGLTTLILILFGEVFLNLFDAEILLKFVYLIPLGVLFIGLYNIFSQWAFRKKDYKSYSKTKLSQSISSNVTKIVLGLLNIGPIGLLLGSILGTSAGITTLLLPIIKKDRELLKRINKGSLLWCAKRYIRFPKFLAPSQLLNVAGIQLPIFFITSLYGTQVIGYYGLANGIVSLPMMLIGNSVSDVFFGEAANTGKSNPKKLKVLSLNLFKKLFLLGLLPLIILFLFGPFLFSLVFGDNWYEAGVYARIIAFLAFTRLIFMPISRVFEVFEKQKEALFLDMLRVFLVLLTFILAMMLSLNSYWTIGLYTLIMSLIYLFTFILSQKIINDQIQKIGC
ncbi:MAG: lipopolysaccharide biosynthesis protein [Ectobacillus sp.]